MREVDDLGHAENEVEPHGAKRVHAAEQYPRQRKLNQNFHFPSRTRVGAGPSAGLRAGRPFRL
ncbi:hypothetical protein D9M68_672120 [compost metagenome]